MSGFDATSLMSSKFPDTAASALTYAADLVKAGGSTTPQRGRADLDEEALPLARLEADHERVRVREGARRAHQPREPRDRHGARDAGPARGSASRADAPRERDAGARVERRAAICRFLSRERGTQTPHRTEPLLEPLLPPGDAGRRRQDQERR